MECCPTSTPADLWSQYGSVGTRNILNVLENQLMKNHLIMTAEVMNMLLVIQFFLQ
jgi:hypothetical protein